MFDHLKDQLSTRLNQLRGLGRLTEANIDAAMRDIRTSLLEADVVLSVANDFIKSVKDKVLGQKVIGNVRPGEAFIKVVQDEMVALLGDDKSDLNLNTQPPVVILMAGLQGSGKTTTTAKLAHWLKAQNKTVMVTSADVYRPAAIEQLKTLATQIDAQYFPSHAKQKPVQIAKGALKAAKQQHVDVLIVDTAGRLHIDDDMMADIKSVSKVLDPTEVLLVVDSMMGQDAVHMAETFNATLELTGVVLTKVDGDARGGAALSMRHITGKPIKFVGMGEKIEALELFYPDRMASRILGMGDIVSLVEKAHAAVDEKQAERIEKKLKKGKRFNFEDFLTQLNQMKKLGGMQSLLGKLPQMGAMSNKAAQFMDDKMTTKMTAMIFSMTRKERIFPALLNGSRKKRIASGSGTSIQDVNKLIKQFSTMQKMLKRFQGDKMMKKMKRMQGNLPPDLLKKLPPDAFK